MTEQVIDIRDRIEKMRTQMTVPNSQGAVQEKRNNLENTELKDSEPDKQTALKVKRNEKLESQTNSNEIDLKSKKLIEDKKQVQIQSLRSKPDKENEFDDSAQNEKKNNFKSKENFKTYEGYHNERVKDEKKQSVKFDEKQPFPQFSLNVSNPISWKLMLLIMLMQLLTNMMLVVVLYLK